MPKPSTKTDMLTGPLGEDRRHWVRYPVRLTIRCQIAGSENGPAWPAQVHNISHGGMKLLCRHSVERGTTILVSPSHPKLLPQLVRLIHVSEANDGNRIVGCEFARELLGDRELLMWGKNQNGKPPPDSVL